MNIIDFDFDGVQLKDLTSNLSLRLANQVKVMLLFSLFYKSLTVDILSGLNLRAVCRAVEGKRQ